MSINGNCVICGDEAATKGQPHCYYCAEAYAAGIEAAAKEARKCADAMDLENEREALCWGAYRFAESCIRALAAPAAPKEE